MRKYKKKIITDIDLFFLSNYKSKSIVVTGTNGKSTTCKLIAHLLKKNKFKFSLGGNIGTPILDIKKSKNSYVIIEASSYQLSHSKFINPDFALFLNLTNDHLEWHGSMKNYLNSKLKIFNHQTDKQFAIINKNFKKIFIKKNFLGKLILPNKKEYDKIKYKINNDYLTSNINDENMSFIYSFSKLLKIRQESFIEAMKTFKGLPHRFEIFLKKKEVTFINDSKATSFVATQSALSSLKNIYWILGGLPKKGDKISLSKYKDNIIKCYLIGKNINFFKKQIKGKLVFSITKNLKNSLIQISKDIKLQKNNKKSVFSAQQQLHSINLLILKRGAMNLKGYVGNMRENSFKFLFSIYWRSIDKKILFCFFSLFFLGLFFSFSSTSSLAGESLTKIIIFFLQNILIFTILAL